MKSHENSVKKPFLGDQLLFSKPGGAVVVETC
jgi:hypothetical protein